ncbi:MAG: hypothetical protein ACRD0W_24490 [Acidimicrobiales bacterium]
MPVPGDIVRHVNHVYVVVDVTGDEPPMAVLRADDDLDLLRPLAAAADGLQVVGHLERLDGWVEDPPGIWSQT